jgi:hypothetical protein
MIIIIIIIIICTVPAFSWLSAITSLLMTILSTDSYKDRIIKIIRRKMRRITVKITCALLYIIIKRGCQKLHYYRVIISKVRREYNKHNQIQIHVA